MVTQFILMVTKFLEPRYEHKDNPKVHWLPDKGKLLLSTHWQHKKLLWENSQRPEELRNLGRILWGHNHS